MTTRYLEQNEAKELICELGRRAYNKGFVSGSDGNLTIKTGDNEIWGTPTGVSKGFMKPENLVKLDLEGNVLEKGELNPSSEIKLHLRIYKENPDINSVVHAHPPYGTVFAIACKPLDEALMPESVVYLGAVPVAEYAKPGSEGVADSIAGFANEYNACFLANHGTLTWGDDAQCLEGFYRLESLEQACKINLHLHHMIQDISPLTREQVDELYDLRKKSGFKRGGVLRILE